MDPYQTLKLIEMHINTNNASGAFEHIGYYKRWRDRRGYEPKIDGMHGDKFLGIQEQKYFEKFIAPNIRKVS